MRLCRRKYLATISITTSVLALPGCSGDSETAGGDSSKNSETTGGDGAENSETADVGNDSSPGDPERMVEEYYSALDNGNVEKVNKLRHSSMSEFNEDNIGFYINKTNLKKTEVIERSKSRALVDVFAEIFGKPSDEVLELRTENGEWKLYDSEEQ